MAPGSLLVVAAVDEDEGVLALFVVVVAPVAPVVVVLLGVVGVAAEAEVDEEEVFGFGAGEEAEGVEGRFDAVVEEDAVVGFVVVVVLLGFVAGLAVDDDVVVVG